MHCLHGVCACSASPFIKIPTNKNTTGNSSIYTGFPLGGGAFSSNHALNSCLLLLSESSSDVDASELRRIAKRRITPAQQLISARCHALARSPSLSMSATTQNSFGRLPEVVTYNHSHNSPQDLCILWPREALSRSIPKGIIPTKGQSKLPLTRIFVTERSPCVRICGYSGLISTYKRCFRSKLHGLMFPLWCSGSQPVYNHFS